jgi:hypothetical protein
VALGAANPEVLISWLFTVDLIAYLSFVAMLMLRLTYDLLTSCAGAIPAEHETGDILGPPSGTRLGRLGHSVREFEILGSKILGAGSNSLYNCTLDIVHLSGRIKEAQAEDNDVGLPGPLVPQKQQDIINALLHRKAPK